VTARPKAARRAVLTALLVALGVLLVLPILFFLLVGLKFRRRVVGPGVVDVPPLKYGQVNA
jgi:hypothetical protein